MAPSHNIPAVLLACVLFAGAHSGAQTGGGSSAQMGAQMGTQTGVQLSEPQIPAHGETRAGAAGHPQRFDQAMLEYEVGHYALAYAGFAALADEGHAEAARLAWQMWRHGRALYGQYFTAGGTQLARWQRVAQCARMGEEGGCRRVSSAP